jgi:hypothetical protein
MSSSTAWCTLSLSLCLSLSLSLSHAHTHTRTAFKNVIVNGLVLAADGKKMSKRLRHAHTHSHTQSDTHTHTTRAVDGKKMNKRLRRGAFPAPATTHVVTRRSNVVACAYDCWSRVRATALFRPVSHSMTHCQP